MKYDTDEHKFPEARIGMWETGSGYISVPCFTGGPGAERMFVCLDMADDDVVALLESAVNMNRARRGQPLIEPLFPDVDIDYRDDS